MIPKVFHFIYLYGKDTLQLNINHRISILSNAIINNPDEIIIHTNNIEKLKSSRDYSKLKSRLTNLKVQSVNKYMGILEEYVDLNQDIHMAHLADMLRLVIMYSEGGVYSDVDSIAFNPLPSSFWDSELPIFFPERYQTNPDALCNGFFLSPIGAEFLIKWLEGWVDYRADECMPGTPDWTKYSVQLGWKLYVSDPSRVMFWTSDTKLEPYYLSYSDTERLFFLDDYANLILMNPFQVHLWETRNRNILKVLSEKYFKTSDATYAQLGRRFL